MLHRDYTRTEKKKEATSCFWASRFGFRVLAVWDLGLQGLRVLGSRAWSWG